ncbi:MAG: EamA family transporter [Erysipelotrichaceae bacterium]|nr:EamA family transporter [Erysipelotrichaceae bacterium]
MERKATVKYLIALSLYGTIGLFLHYITFSSEFVVLCRGLFGSLFIALVLYFRQRKPDREAIRKNLKLLLISGAALGFNWVCLFAGYRHGVAVTSLCNYTAPIIVVIISALIYKEKISRIQIFCIILAFVGILLLLGIFSDTGSNDPACAIYGLLAAAGFVIMVLCNRKLQDIEQLEKTLIQLLASAAVVFPYVLLNKGFPQVFDLRSVILTLILGFVHTGVAYIFYFAAIYELNPQTLAILGYLEPVMNLLCGVLFFHESIGLSGIIGAIMIIAASLGNELSS